MRYRFVVIFRGKHNGEYRFCTIKPDNTISHLYPPWEGLHFHSKHEAEAWWNIHGDSAVSVYAQSSGDEFYTKRLIQV